VLKLSLKKATRLSIILIILIGLGVQVKPAAAFDPLTIIVNLMSDEPDLYTWDGFCDTTEVGAYDCTLRAAIQHTNHTQFEDGTKIIFAIEHGDHAVLGARIQISEALPSLQAPGTTIQGPNITGKPIVLDGQGGAYPGLEIQADNFEIKDLTISHFGGYGIVVATTSTPVTGTKIIGNLIGDFNLFTLESDSNYGGIRLVKWVSDRISDNLTRESSQGETR